MPTLSRRVDERHPVAGWLYRADKLPINGTLVMAFATIEDARRAAAALSNWRSKGRIGPPGSFSETSRDPRGEGIGTFDRIVISQRGCDVHLKHMPEGFASLRAREINPLGVRVLDDGGEIMPDACSRVNVEDFDVITG